MQDYVLDKINKAYTDLWKAVCFKYYPLQQYKCYWSGLQNLFVMNNKRFYIVFYKGKLIEPYFFVYPIHASMVVRKYVNVNECILGKRDMHNNMMFYGFDINKNTNYLLLLPSDTTKDSVNQIQQITTKSKLDIHNMINCKEVYEDPNTNPILKDKVYVSIDLSKMKPCIGGMFIPWFRKQNSVTYHVPDNSE